MTKSEKLVDVVTLLTSYEHKFFPKSSLPLMSLLFPFFLFFVVFSQLALVASLIIHLVTNIG